MLEEKSRFKQAPRNYAMTKGELMKKLVSSHLLLVPIQAPKNGGKSVHTGFGLKVRTESITKRDLKTGKYDGGEY